MHLYTAMMCHDNVMKYFILFLVFVFGNGMETTKHLCRIVMISIVRKVQACPRKSIETTININKIKAC